MADGSRIDVEGAEKDESRNSNAQNIRRRNEEFVKRGACALRTTSVESMMRDLGFAVMPVLVMTQSKRTHSTLTWNRKNETRRRGALVVAR